MTKRNRQIAEFYNRMQRYGIGLEDADALRRIEMTLNRWGATECGDSNEYGSWAIERDELTDKPYMVRHHYRHGQGKDTVSRYPIADREKGALRRLAAIMVKYPDLIAYHQTDPRGCGLYVVPRKEIPTGADISSIYTRGVAVCY